MATIEFPPPQPLTIELIAATKTLRSPQQLRFLVDHLGDLSARSINDLGPLAFAVLELGSEFPVAELLRDMLRQRPEWITQLNNRSENLLMEAVLLRRLDLVDVLLETGVDPTHENNSGHNALEYAIVLQSEPETQELYGNTLLKKGKFSSTQKDRALTYAANNGNLGMVRSLLAHGAGFGSVSTEGNPIAQASAIVDVSKPALEIVRLLLQAKGALEVIDEGWEFSHSPLAINQAAYHGSLDIMAALLEAGARLDPPENLQPGDRQTPLMVAARGLRPEAVDLLIKSGSNPEAIDTNGRNALHYLARHNTWQDAWIEQILRLKAIKSLVTAGTDPLQADFDGKTPLDLAVQRGNPDIIESFSMLAALASSQGLASATDQPEASRSTPLPRM